MLSLANQRPSVPFRAPAVVRHFLYRIPSHFNPRYKSHDQDRAVHWANLLYRINQTLDDYKKAFGCNAPDRFWVRLEHMLLKRPRLSHEALASDTLFVVLQPSSDTQPRIHIRVEIFTETFSITLVEDEIPRGCPTDDDLNRLLEQKDGEALRRVYESGAPVAAMGTLAARSRLNLPPDFVDHRVESANLMALLSEPTPFLDTPFLEIRGLVLPAVGDAAFMPVGNESFDRYPQTTGRLSDNINGFLSEHGDLVRNFVCSSWQTDPGQRPNPGVWTDAELLSAEAVVCGMLGGRVLYASPLSMAPTMRSVVNYLVVYDGESRAQLGQFVRRLHVLAELRLSALMDFDREHGGSARVRLAPPINLIQAGQEMRRIGAMLTKFEQQHSHYTISAKAPFGENDTTLEDNANFIRILEAYFNLNNCSDDGIAFRVERSRYYSDAFKSRIEDLGVVPLDGWQPYDLFVKRYLFQIYDQISSIGVRYQALGARIDRWQSVRIGAEIARQSTSSRRLLERAEDIGLLAGLYYGYNAFQHASEKPLLELLGKKHYSTFTDVLDIFVVVLLVAFLFDTFLGARVVRNVVFRWVGGWHAYLRKTLSRLRDVWTKLFPGRDEQKKPPVRSDAHPHA